MRIKKHLLRLAPVALAFALLQALAPAAQAAPNTISLQLSDPRPAATSVGYTWTWSGFQTATAPKCIRLELDTLADGTGTLPTGASVAAATLSSSSTYMGGTWVADYTSMASGVVVFNQAANVTLPTGSAKTMLFGGITNPSAAAGGSFSALVTVYPTNGTGSSGSCVGTALDAQTSVNFVTTPGTTVSATVDPTLTFSVVGRATACNSQVPTAFNTSATATAVSLGRVNGSASGGGAQDMTLTTNAGGGFTVYIRGTVAGDDMTDGNGHAITDSTGTHASPGTAPAAGAEAFGYTTSDTGTGFAANQFAKLSNTDETVMVASAGVSTETQCVGYQAAVGTGTEAGVYSASVIYTAVPVY